MSRTSIGTALTMSLTVSLTAAGADCPPPPESVTCPGGAQGELIDYVFIEDPPLSDTRASITACGQHEVRLRGWWFTPPPPTETKADVTKGDATKTGRRFKGYPLMVYSHGSEEMKTSSNQSSAKCTIVDPLVDKGFAVFVPHRRGHGKSTGVYYESYRETRSVVDCQDDPVNCQVYKREANMSYLHDQALDVQLATLVAKQLPNVDQTKVSLMGHSFGAMVTMFANEIDVGQRAVVNFAGGGESWDGDPCRRDREEEPNPSQPPLCRQYNAGVLQDYLYTAVDRAKAPVFSFDTNHDVSVAPVYELPYHAWSRYRDRYQATLYGPVNGLSCKFPDPDTGETVSCDPDEGPLKLCPADPSSGEQDRCGNVAHSAFASQTDQIARWMPAVLEFLKRHKAH